MQPYATVPVTVLMRLQRKFSLRVAEWMTALMLISWGVEMSVKPDMFAVPFFTAFSRIAPQTTWIVVVMLVGFARLTALGINGAWRFSSHVRFILLVLSVWIWGGVMTGVLGWKQPTLAVAIYPWLAGADLYAAYRAGRDARAADDEARLILHG